MSNMYKKCKKQFIIFLSGLLTLFMLPISAFAYNTFSGHKLINGVGNYGANNQTYWIDSTASVHAGNINTAMSDWIYTSSYNGVSTPISFVQTTTISNSRIDVYKVTTTNDWWGLTQMINDGNSINPETSNWLYTKVLLDSNFGTLSSTSDDNRQKAVIAHEIGHCMGLAHTTMNTLMRADIAYCSPGIYRAQANDCDGINYLYK